MENNITDNFLFIDKKLGYILRGNFSASKKDMTKVREIAIKNFLNILNYDEKKYLKAKLKYKTASYNYHNKNYISALSCYKLTLRNGSIILKLLSLIRIIMISIKKIKS